jgi:tetratricopeptide (TPR) repeat protein
MLLQPSSPADAEQLEGLMKRLCALAPTVTDAPTAPPAAPLGGERLRLTGECELGEEIGRGGMGQVLQGRDLELGRELAVKVLRPEYRDQSAAARRFLEEARVCGRLQHPGVVPVHAVGRLPDGRPYFTMKLVRGRTLAQLLAERASPASELPRFVQVFEQVCQTVAYAHSNGVIHRDLKPANVMVGAFGEVQVMDWGLAKHLGEASGERQPPVDKQPGPNGSGGPDATQEGTILGTPAYMAPEQARGEVGRLDERADVFGLGAILCEVLTGRAPFDGPDALQLAMRADLADTVARLNGCGADTELIALAKACLAPRPDDRPADAGAVARGVTAYREGVEQRLRQAEIDRGKAEVERVAAQQKALLERKRRRVQLGLAAAVLLLVLTGGAAAWLLQQQQAARRQADRETGLVLERGRGLLAAARPTGNLDRLAEVKTEADRAVDIARSGGASAAVHADAAAFQAEAKEQLERAERNRVLLRDLLDVSAPREVPAYIRDDRGAMAAVAEPSVDEQYAAAFRRWGDLDVDGGTEAAVAARLREEPEAVVQEVLAALDAWMLHRRSTWMLERRPKQREAKWRRLFGVANELDHNPRSRQLRALLVGEPRAEAVAGLLGAWPPWPAMWWLTQGQTWLKLQELQKQADPATEPVLALVLLARGSEAIGDAAGAEDLLTQAVEARPDEVVLLDALARLLSRRGRVERAVERRRAVRTLRPQLGVALAQTLVTAGRGAEAEGILRDLIRRQPNNPELHFYLGRVLQVLKKWEGAEAAYRKATEFKPDYFEAYNNLGIALAEQKKLDEAVAAYQKTIALKPDDAFAYSNLGIALREQKKLEEAIAACRKAIDLQPDFAAAYYNLGHALLDQEKLDEAVTAWRKAISLRPDYARATYNLGIVLWKQKKPDEAAAALREAIHLSPDDAEAHLSLGAALMEQKRLDEAVGVLRQAIKLKKDYAEAYTNLGSALHHQKKLDEAVAAHRKAIALKPGFAIAYYNLGLTLVEQTKLNEAADAFGKAITFQPDFVEAYYSLGLIRVAQKQLAEAVVAFRRVIELKKDYAEAYTNLGVVLTAQNKLDEAVAAFRQAIALQPDDATAYYNLGNVLREQKKLEEAVTAFRKALTLRPDYAVAWNNLGNLLREQKKWDEAVAALRQAVAFKPDYAEAYYNLGGALREQKKLAEAVAAFEQADRLLPNHPVIRNTLRQMQSLLALDRKLAAWLADQDRPDSPRQAAELAAFCAGYRERYHAGSRLFADAFRAAPTLADDLQAGHRYNAACAAARAAAGQGRDAATLPAGERLDLRRQALAWLRADLDAWRRRVTDGNPRDRSDAGAALRHWRQDADLSSVCHPWALLRRPADERRAWQRLWAEVDAMLWRASVVEAVP